MDLVNAGLIVSQVSGEVSEVTLSRGLHDAFEILVYYTPIMIAVTVVAVTASAVGLGILLLIFNWGEQLLNDLNRNRNEKSKKRKEIDLEKDQ